VAGVLEAVLFDWGHTLMDWVWDEELLEAGVRAGLEAVGAPPDRAAPVAARYRAEVRLTDWEVPEEVEYEPLVRTMLAESGVDVDEDALRAYLLAEHAAWAPARRRASMSVALLDALHERGLKTGLVSNSMDPPWILLRDLEEQELAERLDATVFSSEIGVRKPRPEIFLAALERLGVSAESSLFVGDRLEADVRGARDVGMRTVQAMWFRAEEDVDGVEPDFRAFTQVDVLNIVRRLTGEL
jgi:putative hydrolase of the HAD superfamily